MVETLTLTFYCLFPWVYPPLPDSYISIIIYCLKGVSALKKIRILAFGLFIILLSSCGSSAPPANILHSGKVTLTWEDVPGAATYNVYLSRSLGATVLNSYKISDVTNPFTITDLNPGTTYYFVVTVEDDWEKSRRSKEISYKVVRPEGIIQFGNIFSHPKPVAKISE